MLIWSKIRVYMKPPYATGIANASPEFEEGTQPAAQAERWARLAASRSIQQASREKAMPDSADSECCEERVW